MGARRGDFQLSIGCDIDAHITPLFSGKGAPYLAASNAGQFAKHDNRVKRSGHFFASNVCAHGHDIARAKCRYSVYLEIILCALYHRFDSCRGYGKLTVNFPKDYGISGVIKPDSILKKRDTVLFVVVCFKPDIKKYVVIHVRRIVENADVGKLGYGITSP